MCLGYRQQVCMSLHVKLCLKNELYPFFFIFSPPLTFSRDFSFCCMAFKSLQTHSFSGSSRLGLRRITILLHRRRMTVHRKSTKFCGLLCGRRVVIILLRNFCSTGSDFLFCNYGNNCGNSFPSFPK